MDNFHLRPDGGPESHVPVGSLGIDSHGDSRDDFFSTEIPSRPATPAAPDNHPRGSSSRRKARKIVLCFDGTGNKFHGDDSDSNILKIFRMLDRTASDQCRSSHEPGLIRS